MSFSAFVHSHTLFLTEDPLADEHAYWECQKGTDFAARSEKLFIMWDGGQSMYHWTSTKDSVNLRKAVSDPRLGSSSKHVQRWQIIRRLSFLRPCEPSSKIIRTARVNLAPLQHVRIVLESRPVFSPRPSKPTERSLGQPMETRPEASSEAWGEGSGSRGFGKRALPRRGHRKVIWEGPSAQRSK